jgi:hypothetical protein
MKRLWTLLAAAFLRSAQAETRIPFSNDLWVAMETAAIGGTLTPAQQDMLARHRRDINDAALLGQIPDRIFQGANAAATRRLENQAATASSAAGGRMTIQAKDPARSGGADPGGDVDTINRNVISPLQIIVMQRAFNDQMNRGASPEQQRADWQRRLDVDFMAHPAALKDKDFAAIARLNNDAYKSRAAADYEARARAPGGAPIPPQLTAAYVAEMAAFADKKARELEALRANPQVNADPNLRARLATVEAQQMKYINRIAAATDRAREERGLPPVSRDIARAADLGSRRGSTPTAEQKADLRRSGQDFQAERAAARSQAGTLLERALGNFDQTRNDLGLPAATPPPAAPPVAPTSRSQTVDAGRASSTFTRTTDGQGKATDDKATTSQSWRGDYVGTRVTVTGQDSNPEAKPPPASGVAGRVQAAVDRNITETKVEIERVRGSQLPPPGPNTTPVARVVQDRTTVTRVNPFGLGELVGTVQRTTQRDSFARTPPPEDKSKPPPRSTEIVTTRTTTRTSGFTYESGQRQGSITWEAGQRTDHAVSREWRPHGAALPPDNRTDWKVPALNIKLFERSVTNTFSEGRTLVDSDNALGRTRVVVGSSRITGTVSGTADERNAKLEAALAFSANAIEARHSGNLVNQSLTQNTRLTVRGTATGNVGVEARSGASLSGGEDGLKADLSAGAFVGGKLRAEVQAGFDARQSWLPVNVGYRGSMDARLGAGAEAGLNAQLGWGGFKVGGKFGTSVGVGGGMSHAVEVDFSRATLGVDLTQVERDEAKARLLDQYRTGLTQGDLVLLPGHSGQELKQKLDRAVEEHYNSGKPLPDMASLGVVPQDPLVIASQMRQRVPRDSEESLILRNIEQDLSSRDPARRAFAEGALRDIRAAGREGIPVSTGAAFVDGGGNLRRDPVTGASGLQRDLQDIDRLLGQTRPGSREEDLLHDLALDLKSGDTAEAFVARSQLERVRGLAHDDPNWAKPPPVNPFQAQHDAEDRERWQRLRETAEPGSPEAERLAEIRQKLESEDRGDRNSAWADLNQLERERATAAEEREAGPRAVQDQAMRDGLNLAEAAGYAPPGSDEERAVRILADRIQTGTPEQQARARAQLGDLLAAQRESGGLRAAVAQAGPDAVGPGRGSETPVVPEAPGPRWSQAELESHNHRMSRLDERYRQDLAQLERQRAAARDPRERAALDEKIGRKKDDLAWVADQVAQNNDLLLRDHGVAPPPPTAEELAAAQADLNRQAGARESLGTQLDGALMRSRNPEDTQRIFGQIESNRAALVATRTQAAQIGSLLEHGTNPPALPAGPSPWTNEGLDNDIWNMRNLQGRAQSNIEDLRTRFGHTFDSTERARILAAIQAQEREIALLQARIDEDEREKDRNRRAGTDWSEGADDGGGDIPSGLADLLADLMRQQSGEGLAGSGVGDNGGASVEGGVIGGDVAGDSRRDRQGFAGRDGAHVGDAGAGMSTGEANPLGDLAGATAAIGSAVQGVRDGIQGVRDIREQIEGDDDEGREGETGGTEGEGGPADGTGGGGNGGGNPPDGPRGGGEKKPPGDKKKPPHEVTITRTGPKPPGGGGGGGGGTGGGGAGVSKPPAVGGPVKPPPPSTPPPITGGGASGYVVCLQSGDFLGAGPMENYLNRKAALEGRGKPMDWIIQAGPFGSSSAAHRWILDNSEPGGVGGFMAEGRIYKGKSVRVRENLESYAR